MSKIETPKGFPTLDQLVAKTREIAAAQPKKVYQRLDVFGNHNDALPNCVYVEEMPGGQLIPSCILGHAFVDLGVDPEVLKTENLNEDDQEIVAVLMDLGYEFDRYEDERVAWLRSVQGSQDIGTAWGAAVSEADADVD
jgi:hypothetical protein